MHDSFETALARLPHGAAFRFVDELRELVPGKSGTAAYRLRGDEPFLAGHFPGQPLMPGVLLLEAVAQLAGIVAQSDPAMAPLEGLKLTAVRAAKILGTVRPGESVELRAEIVGRMGLLIQAQGWAYGTGRLLLATEITLSGEPPRSPPSTSG